MRQPSLSDTGMKPIILLTLFAWVAFWAIVIYLAVFQVWPWLKGVLAANGVRGL